MEGARGLTANEESKGDGQQPDADRPLRIAQVASPWLTVPPQSYGGIEAMIAHLCDGLVERGHQVTLFASGGSVTKAELVTRYDDAPGMAEAIDKPHLQFPHILQAYERAGDFDVIHDHTFPLGPSIAANLPRPPVVHTVHGPPDHPTARPIYESLGDRVNLVAISNFQRQSVPGLNYVATVYNGIDVDAHPFREKKDDYLLFVGRMTADKGVHLAVETAGRLERRLRVVGKMAEPAEIAYFEDEVKPRLTPDIEILGETSAAQKLELYAGATATLVPIQWPEPFGLVMVESMACGTPVVALRNGSVPEVVEHGVTGFIADDLDSFVAAVAEVGEIDPAECRRAVERKFSKGAMVDGYQRVYRSVGA
jgi:glycosyltransferase involved in cell wall biosynthesis